MTSGPPRRISHEERRARLGRRHRLAEGAQANDPAGVTHDLVALHSTDPASVFLAAAARMRAPDVAAIERSLYDDRSIVRMLGMRRTMFVVPVDLVPVVHAACTRDIEARERRRTVQFLEQGGVTTDGAAWLRAVEDDTLAALQARGEALATELSADVPALKTQVATGQGTNWPGSLTMSTRVLFLLAAQGRIVRGRPRGSWVSSLYRWAPVETWLPGDVPELPAETARAELARRWLAAFGPATPADLKWWAGWTAGQTKKALAQVAPIEVDLDEGTGLVLASDVAPVTAPQPWGAFLPALDPTAMGWAGRAWYLGDHRPALFDRSGNVGPTVWWDGRIVGGWAQRKGGELVFRLLSDVGADAVATLQGQADRLGEWLAGTRVTPRFRTPLERELVA